MKINIIDDNHMVIYIKGSSNNIDFSNEINLEKTFEKLFKNLKNYYNFILKGFYNINIYRDKFYGSILEINKEDIPYYDYLDNHIDMQFNLNKNINFLFQVDDYYFLTKELKNKIIVYLYKDKIYIQIRENIDSILIGKLMEFGKIIYKDIDFIINHSKIVDL